MPHDGAPDSRSGETDDPPSTRQRKNPILTGDSQASIINDGLLVFNELGKEMDKKLDTRQSWEFGGSVGLTAMMLGFPLLMYYPWICLTFYNGQLVHPNLADEIVPFLERMWVHVKLVNSLSSEFRVFFLCEEKDAAPTPYAFTIYTGLMGIQLQLAFIMPGYQQVFPCHRWTTSLCSITATLFPPGTRHWPSPPRST